MKFIREHYEKVALITGVVTLGVAVYFSISGSSSTEKFITANNGSGNFGKVQLPIDSERLAIASDLIEKEVILEPTLNEASQETFMAQSIPLVGKKGSKFPINPLDPKAESIHPGIPNSYWYEKKLVETMGLENAPLLDPDGDGFSVIEEFKKGTHPNDKSDHPELLAKLGVEGVEVNVFSLNFTSGGANSIYLRLVDTNKGVRVDEQLRVGELGPKDPRKLNAVDDFAPYKDRFKLLRKFSEEGRQFIELEDQKGNKTKHKISRSEGEKIDDRVGLFFLNALGLSDAPAVKLAAGSRFGLPFDSEDKHYLVVSIELQSGSDILYEVKVVNTKTKKGRTLEAYKVQ